MIMIIKLENIKKHCIILLTFAFSFFTITGCSSLYSDKSLKTKSYKISENKIKKNTVLALPNSDLSDIYTGITDMYYDSDYVLAGIIKDIEYFQVKYTLLRKINVLIKKSFKGSIEENSIISVLENDGYVRLKSMYEDAKKYYEDKKGDKNKEDAWLRSVTYMSDIKDIKNDMLIRYTYYDKEDSKIGDELLLFLTNSSDDTYKDKKVKLALNQKLSYPKGAYVSMGLWMGKFTRVNDAYIRYQWYYTKQAIDSNQTNQKLVESYTIREMEDELKKLKIFSYSKLTRSECQRKFKME